MNVLPKTVIGVLLFLLVACTDSPQQADPDFKPHNTQATFSPDKSPVIVVDEAHHNFLTIENRYKPFAMVLASDGFTVKANTARFAPELLEQADILVIANALDRERSDWQPPFDQALDDNEVANIKQWISEGGSLLLIADHTPFPAMIDNLALAFGFRFSNGHVNSYVFRKADNTLIENQITYSNRESPEPVKSDMPLFIQALQQTEFQAEQIHQVKTFGGSAFRAPEEAEVLLKLGRGVVSLEPEIPFEITSTTPKINIDGWSQGAIMTVGKGRLAVFSEGMMFSSQLDTKTGQKYGFRATGAEQNEQFLLNVIRWLADKK